MSDNANHSWMEPLLKQHLGRVPAPAGLWNELQNPRPTKSVAQNRLAWAAVAAMFVLGVALGGHSYVRHAMTLQAAASNPIRHNPAQTAVKFAFQAACQVCHAAGEL